MQRKDHATPRHQHCTLASTRGSRNRSPQLQQLGCGDGHSQRCVLLACWLRDWELKLSNKSDSRSSACGDCYPGLGCSSPLAAVSYGLADRAAAVVLLSLLLCAGCRDADGRPSCIRDECAHRACPLSLGQVVDGKVSRHGTSFFRLLLRLRGEMNGAALVAAASGSSSFVCLVGQPPFHSTQLSCYGAASWRQGAVLRRWGPPP